MFRLLTLPFRLAAGSAKAGWYAGRTVGAGRAVFFSVGFATGVLAASPKARRLALTGVSRVTVAVAEARRPSEPPPPTGPVLPTD